MPFHKTTGCALVNLVPGSISNGGYADVTATATTGNPSGLILPPGFVIKSIDVFGAFSAVAEKNTGPATGTPTFNTGYEAVPSALVPEPAVWTLMLLGAGLTGACSRSARRTC
jgi:hypothetical protein